MAFYGCQVQALESEGGALILAVEKYRLTWSLRNLEACFVEKQAAWIHVGDEDLGASDSTPFGAA